MKNGISCPQKLYKIEKVCYKGGVSIICLEIAARDAIPERKMEVTFLFRKKGLIQVNLAKNASDSLFFGFSGETKNWKFQISNI